MKKPLDVVELITLSMRVEKLSEEGARLLFEHSVLDELGPEEVDKVYVMLMQNIARAAVEHVQEHTGRYFDAREMYINFCAAILEGMDEADDEIVETSVFGENDKHEQSEESEAKLWH